MRYKILAIALAAITHTGVSLAQSTEATCQALPLGAGDQKPPGVFRVTKIAVSQELWIEVEVVNVRSRTRYLRMAPEVDLLSKLGEAIHQQLMYARTTGFPVTLSRLKGNCETVGFTAVEVLTEPPP